jgi:pyruvate,water dikinase
MRRYGHRGPSELELSQPRPIDDPDWLDRQLAEAERNPIDAPTLLAKQRRAHEAAWSRFEANFPHKADKFRRQLGRMATAARTREAVRSEVVRLFGVFRCFAIRASELTGLAGDIFFLSIEEILAVLAGDRAATESIPARREIHAHYAALPPYPPLINGRFDPFRWAANPNRRIDYFDAKQTTTPRAEGTITGFAGAAGIVEGLVRRLTSPEDGDQLQPGEILVTVTTNVGWTPLFPRAGAIVTDVGAPLSHAAIVARELGIPAVVGCGDATMRLKTGDRVRVDGGQGTVEILSA